MSYTPSNSGIGSSIEVHYKGKVEISFSDGTRCEELQANETQLNKFLSAAVSAFKVSVIVISTSAEITNVAVTLECPAPLPRKKGRYLVSDSSVFLDFDLTVEDSCPGATCEAVEDSFRGTSNLTTMKRTRIKFTIKIGSETDGIDASNATHNCIEQINSILDGLAHTIPGVKAMIWHVPDDGCITSEDIFKSFLSAFPGAFKFVERNLLGFNRFCQPDRSYKMRLQLIYPESVQLSRIAGQLAQWKIPRIQSFVVSPSDAPDPISFGSLTGSVQEMSTNKDFHYILKKLFKFKHLGLTWEFPRNDQKDNYHINKMKLTIEVDRSDEHKWDSMETYFNNSSSALANNFLGLPMILVPTYDNNQSAEVKLRISDHIELQGSFGQSLRSVRVSGLQLNNWYDKRKKMTLHEALMSVESITEKIAGHGKHKKSFFGRLFYAILFSKDAKVATFFYIPANSKEARGVANGLPCFLKSVMKIKNPSFYCSQDRMIIAEQGFWDKKERSFMTLKEKEETDRMSAFKDVMESVPITTAYISKAHANTMLVEGENPLDDDNVSRMTKGTLEPDLDSQGASAGSGSTRSSKVFRATNAQKLEFMKCQAITAEKLVEKDEALTEQAEEIKRLRAQLTSTKVTLPDEVSAGDEEENVSILGDDDDDNGLDAVDDDDGKMPPKGDEDQHMDDIQSTTDNGDKHSENDNMESDEDSTGMNKRDNLDAEDASAGSKSRALVTYAEVTRTPERRRKGKSNSYEYGGRSESGTGTRKKSNLSNRVSDPQHQTNVIALDNSVDESEQTDDSNENNQQQNTNIPAKGLRGDGES